MSGEFFTSLNSKTISECYDDKYFTDILSMIKSNYHASEVLLVDKFANRMSDELFCDEKGICDGDCVIDITEDGTKKLVIRNSRDVIEYKDLLASILRNIFKNKALIEKVEREKYTDSLLKVKNRYAFDKLLANTCSYNNLGVAFVDANGLGVINNMYGYRAGDELLKTVTKSLTDNFKSEDIYRIGGDEFVVICLNISKDLFYEKLTNGYVYLNTTPYSASYGASYREKTSNLSELIEETSIMMKKSKEKYREEHPEEYIDKYKVKYKGEV